MPFNDTVQNGSAIYDTQNTLAQKLAKRKLSQMQAQNAGDEQKRALEAYTQQMAEQNNANTEAQAQLDPLNNARAEQNAYMAQMDALNAETARQNASVGNRTPQEMETARQYNAQREFLPAAPTTPNDLRNKLPAAPTANERLKKIAISRRSIGI